MTERITEALLRDIERSIGVPPLAPNSVIAGPLQVMIAEVRRLRGLIGAMHGVQVDGTFGDSREGIYCVSCVVDHKAESCPTDAMEAEAKAIAEEGK